MNFTEIFNYFVYSVFPLLVLVIGLPGNLFALIVLNQKKLKNIGPILIYKCLLISDSLFLPLIIPYYLQTGFNYDLFLISAFVCKLVMFLNYYLDAFSPWLIVYISIEKYISIAYANKRFILRQKLIQIIFAISLFLFSFVFYLPDTYFYDIIINTDNNLTSCNYINFKSQLISSWMDFIYRFCVTFVLMITLSVLIVITVFKSTNTNNNNRISNTRLTKQEKKRFKRDIRFAISSFSMNILAILLYLPNGIVYFFPSMYSIWFYFTSDLFFLGYGQNFYVLLFTNSIFRNEFLALFRKKNVPVSRKTNNVIGNERIGIINILL